MSVSPSATRAWRVLIADDESLIRLDLREMLSELGYDVIGEAGDGRTALDLSRKLQPDIVIMDIKMPELDGIAVAEELTREKIAPVVLLTAYSDQSLVERAKEAGVVGYVVKPFRQAELQPVIDSPSPASTNSAPSSARWATCARRWKRAKSWSGPRVSSWRRTVCVRPTLSIASARRAWTPASRCARSPRPSSSPMRWIAAPPGTASSRISAISYQPLALGCWQPDVGLLNLDSSTVPPFAALLWLAPAPRPA